MMTFIPTTYFSKSLYTEIWGDPCNPHAVDVPATPYTKPHRGGPILNVLTLASTLRQRLVRHHPVNSNCATQS
ncbi:hypothetical protein ABIB57_002304 [Devosia sp. UYZn731]|uniref:hypothetical protein n=1 Tax=Devosia sp. UYZn731 TaxID=3156345 RepID=UPI0033977C3A